jgi:hypothetical protein
MQTFLKNGVLRRAATGSMLGSLLAACLIAVGLIRLLGVLLVAFFRGVHPQFTLSTWRDVRPFAYYVLGFALAGSLIGVLSPWLRRAGAVYAAAAVGGMIVMTLVVAADKGLNAAQRSDWLIVVVLGTVFGGAAAWGWLRVPQP